MNKLKRIIPVVMMLSGFFCLFAEKLTLTVEQAADYAVKNSRTLKSAAIDLEIARLKKENCWNVFIPSVQATGTMSRSNKFTDPMASLGGLMETMGIQVPVTEETESAHWKAIGGVSANLNLSAALIYATKATTASYEAGLITWEQNVSQIKRDVKKMFYALLLQQENLKLQKDMLENSRQRVIQAETSFKNGHVPELTYLQAQVAYENKKPSVLEMEYTIMQQFRTFAFLLGLPTDTELEFTGSIEPEFQKFDVKELITKSLSNRVDIKSLNKNLELLKLSLAATKMQTFTPALSLGWSFQPVLADISADWFKSESWFDNGSLTATVAWNLTNMLPFSANMVSIKETEKNIEKLELSLLSVIQNAELEIQSIVEKLYKSEAAIVAGKYNVELAEKAYIMTKDAYNIGTTELLDLKDAESQLAQSKLGLLNEKYNYLSGLIDLRYAINNEKEEE